MQNILCEQDALKLNQEEIGELLEIFQDFLDGFLWQGVVFTRTERACQTLVENKSASSLSGGGYWAESYVSNANLNHQWSIKTGNSPPSEIYKNLNTHRRSGKNRAARMKNTTLAKEMAVARGRSHCRMVSWTVLQPIVIGATHAQKAVNQRMVDFGMSVIFLVLGVVCSLNTYESIVDRFWL